MWSSTPARNAPGLGTVEAVAQSGDVAQVAGARRGGGLDLDGDDSAVGPLKDDVCFAPRVVAVVVERHALGAG